MYIERSEVDGGQRFQILFIMGTNKIIVRDRNITDGRGGFGEMEISLEEIVTEENFERIFSDAAEALYKSGDAGPRDRVLCTTYPKGSRIVRVGGRS